MSVKVINSTVSDKAFLQYKDIFCPIMQEVSERFESKKGSLGEFLFQLKVPFELKLILKLILVFTAQKTKFSIKDFFSKCKGMVRAVLKEDLL